MSERKKIYFFNTEKYCGILPEKAQITNVLKQSAQKHILL
jgi:hypothetical protein